MSPGSRAAAVNVAVAGSDPDGTRAGGGTHAGGTRARRVASAGTDRWELLRALGALTATAPPAGHPISRALGLAPATAADHTRLFVLDLPPHAAIHLGPEGKLGGEGADRVAGLWRALSLDPPADADHLACMLWLYAELGATAGACRTAAARRRLEHARSVLLWEHLASWLPGYLAAAKPYPAAAGWSDLTLAALRRELAATAAAPMLPAALRHAPAPVGPDGGGKALIDAMTAPVRTGFVLTALDVARAGADIGVGVRAGERRFALQTMADQDPRATLGWLATHARRWAGLHATHAAELPASAWWAERAAATAATLQHLAAEA